MVSMQVGTPCELLIKTISIILLSCDCHLTTTDPNRNLVLSSGGCPLLITSLTSCSSLPAEKQYNRLKCVACGCLLNVSNDNGTGVPHARGQTDSAPFPPQTRSARSCSVSGQSRPSLSCWPTRGRRRQQWTWGSRPSMFCWSQVGGEC